MSVVESTHHSPLLSRACRTPSTKNGCRPIPPPWPSWNPPLLKRIAPASASTDSICVARWVEIISQRQGRSNGGWRPHRTGLPDTEPGFSQGVCSPRVFVAQSVLSALLTSNCQFPQNAEWNTCATPPAAPSVVLPSHSLCHHTGLTDWLSARPCMMDQNTPPAGTVACRAAALITSSPPPRTARRPGTAHRS